MKRKYCIQVQIVYINDFREEFIRDTFVRYTDAVSLSQAINNVRFSLRKEGYKIGKGDHYDDYGLNQRIEYRFSEVVKETKEDNNEVYYPDYDELEDFVRECDLSDAQELYEWEDESWHLPDSNKEELLRYMKLYSMSNIF